MLWFKENRRVESERILTAMWIYKQIEPFCFPPPSPPLKMHINPLSLTLVHGYHMVFVSNILFLFYQFICVHSYKKNLWKRMCIVFLFLLVVHVLLKLRCTCIDYWFIDFRTYYIRYTYDFFCVYMYRIE